MGEMNPHVNIYLSVVDSSFGVKPLGKLQPLLKSLAKIFGHTDKTVRAEVGRFQGFDIDVT